MREQEEDAAAAQHVQAAVAKKEGRDLTKVYTHSCAIVHHFVCCSNPARNLIW